MVMLWAFMCICSGIFCYYLILLQLRRYNENRISTTIATTAYPIWKVNFPAVTVCNFNSVYKANMAPIVNLLQSQHIEESVIDQFFGNLSRLIIQTSSKLSADLEMGKFEKIIKVLETNGYNTDKLMKELAHPCDKMLRVCAWLGVQYNCTDLFQPITTSMGYCCSFNYNAHINPARENVDHFSAGIGAFFGILVYLDMEDGQYVSSAKQVSGAYVMIHEKYDYPVVAFHGVTILEGTDLRITVHPEVIITDPDVRSLKRRQRGCLFDDEKESTWAVEYSFPTCTQEYYATLIAEMCGCVPFYLPYSGTARYCTLLDTQCLESKRDNYTTVANTRILYDDEDDSDAEDDTSICYPECDEVNYRIIVEKHTKMLATEQEQNFTVVRVYPRSIATVKMNRSIYLTWDTILASVGGIFGLCLGGSVLSFVELIYVMVYWLVKGEKMSKKKAHSAAEYKPKIYLEELNLYRRSKNKNGKNYFRYISSQLPDYDDKKKINNKSVPKVLNNQLKLKY